MTMKGYLLDTDVVSELRRHPPGKNVAAWLKRRVPEELYLANLTIGELQRGASKLGNTRRAVETSAWIDALINVQFVERILMFDMRSARRWGRMMGEHDHVGKTLPSADAQIAAVALEHDLVAVTRNEKDFRRMISDIVNPFEPMP